MTSKLTKLFVAVLIVIGTSSCTDWNAEYQKRLEQSAQPVMKKYNYCDNIYDKTLNKNRKVYEDIDKVDDATLDLLSEYIPYNDPQFHDGYDLDKLSNALFVHIPSGIDNVASSLFNKSIHSYHYFYNEEIFDKGYMKNVLNQFNEVFIQPLKKADYLVVAENIIKVEPKIKRGGFSEGAVMCNVTIYDLRSFSEIDSYTVTAVNSNTVTAWKSDGKKISNGDLSRDLYRNLKKIIIQKLIDDSPVRFDIRETPAVQSVQ